MKNIECLSDQIKNNLLISKIEIKHMRIDMYSICQVRDCVYNNVLFVLKRVLQSFYNFFPLADFSRKLSNLK